MDELLKTVEASDELHTQASQAEGRMVDVPAISKATRVGASGVERWLRVLQERKLVELADRNGFTAQLTASGIEKVERLLDRNGN